MKRFFGKRLNENQILIDGAEHNHLKNVLRLKIQDEIVVIGLDKYEYVCKIEEISKNYTVANIINRAECLANPKVELTVFQALVKNDNMGLITQKLSEIGVSRIIPFESEFITSKDSKNKQSKFQEIANQSIKQCKRTTPLIFDKTLSFKEVLEAIKTFDVVVFANEKENCVSINEALKKINKDGKVALIVGSEGGFSDSEIDSLLKLENVKSVTLGKRILRAETASILISGLILYELNEYF